MNFGFTPYGGYWSAQKNDVVTALTMPTVPDNSNAADQETQAVISAAYTMPAQSANKFRGG